tara:strand:- start:949 stop:1401 length:453 start_codon:yes stop_codon:yes gene_type:complete
MTTNALVHVTRNRAFALKYLTPALNFVQKNWKGIMGHSGSVAGALWIESAFDDDNDLAPIVEQAIGHELTDDEKEYAIQTYKDLADDIISDDIFTPFSKRLNEFIQPTHLIIDMHTRKAWVTNNYNSNNYVKSIKRNRVPRSWMYRKKRN